MTDLTATRPIPLGTVVKPWGRIDAIGILSGERYYWLTKRGAVSMLPAILIEPTVAAMQRAKGAG